VRDGDLVGVGLDLEPTTLVRAYSAGMFPMRLSGRRGPLGWWSPDPRGIVPLEGVHVGRTLRAACRRFEITVSQDFDAVVAACADPRRPGGWIGKDIRKAYGRLARLGVAHSIEVRDPSDGSLAGGLYGVCIGGLFAGESMFHHRTNASKVAVVALARMMSADGVAGRLFDVQWTTPHLCTLGAVDVTRVEYLSRLAVAVRLPAPPQLRSPTSWTR
jgi:leucyl/phenylalanyl-tRNA---protein transferase